MMSAYGEEDPAGADGEEEDAEGVGAGERIREAAQDTAATCCSAGSFFLTLFLLPWSFVLPLWSGVMVFVHYATGTYEPQVVSGGASVVAMGMGFAWSSLLLQLTPLTLPASIFSLWGAAYCVAEAVMLSRHDASALVSGTVANYRTVLLNPSADDAIATDLLTIHIVLSSLYAFVGVVVGVATGTTFVMFVPSMLYRAHDVPKYALCTSLCQVWYQKLSPNSVWVTSWWPDGKKPTMEVRRDDGKTVEADETKEHPIRVRVRSLWRDAAWAWHPTAVCAKIRTVVAWMYLATVSAELSVAYLALLRPNGLWFPSAHHANAPMTFVVSALVLPLAPLGYGSKRAYRRLWRHVAFLVLGIWSYVVSVYAHAQNEIDIDASVASQSVLSSAGERCWGNYNCFYQLCLGSVQTIPTTFFFERSTNTSFRVLGADCRSFAQRTTEIGSIQLTLVVLGGVFLVSHAAHVYYMWRDTRRDSEVLDEVERRRSAYGEPRGTCGSCRRGVWANNTWPPAPWSSRRTPP